MELVSKILTAGGSTLGVAFTAEEAITYGLSALNAVSSSAAADLSALATAASAGTLTTA